MPQDVTIYRTDSAGRPLVAPFTVEKLFGNSRKWAIYGRRSGVSATVLCRACSHEFKTRRDARIALAAIQIMFAN